MNIQVWLWYGVNLSAEALQANYAISYCKTVVWLDDILHSWYLAKQSLKTGKDVVI